MFFNHRGEIVPKAQVDGAVQPGVGRGAAELGEACPGFESSNAPTSEKLADMGNSGTVYSVLVEVE